MLRADWQRMKEAAIAGVPSARARCWQNHGCGSFLRTHGLGLARLGWQTKSCRHTRGSSLLQVVVGGGRAGAQEVEEVLLLSCAQACSTVEAGSSQHMDGALSARAVLTR